MKLLVDSSILIDYLRGGFRGQRFIDMIEEDQDVELFLPTIVIFELFSGESTKNPIVAKRILNFLDFFQRIELDEEIAKSAGQLYRDINKTLQVPDYIIAASCLSIGGTLVTLNRKHFEQVPQLRLYDEINGN